MEEKVDELLPAYLNEFNSSFIRALYKKVTGGEVDSWQVERAVATVSGNKAGVCSRDKVSVVLIELERRHTLEDKIKWDFMLLGGGSPGISLDNVYILFKTYFGDKFGRDDWSVFVKNRGRSGPASFLELRNAICDFTPRSDSNSDSEDLLEELRKPKITVAFSETEMEKQMRRQRYRDRANNWLGQQRKSVSVGNVDLEVFISALESKYNLLRKVALRDALEQELGEEAWLLKTEPDKEELITSLEDRVLELRDRDRLRYCDHTLDMKGLLTIKNGLSNVMGLHQLQARIFLDKMIKHRQKLFRAGRDETYVREVEMREYTRKRKENESIATNIINDLQLRFEEEKVLLEKEVSSGGSMSTSRSRDNLLALLYFQQYRAGAEQDFRASVISVALTEHVSPLPEQRLFEDYDRWYNLARYRVTRLTFEDEYDSLTGIPLAPSSLPPVLSLTTPQNNIRDCFVLLQRAHDAESVFLQLLLFSDIEEEDHIKLLSSSQTELWQGLAHLRQLRADWRLRYDGGTSRQEKLTEQYELLRKAMFIKVLLVQYRDNLLEDVDTAMVAVMSELVQIQEAEMAVLTYEKSVKTSDEVVVVKESLSNRMHVSYLDNVACVLLRGSNEIDDNDLLETINTKYEELKNVWNRWIVKKNKNKGLTAKEMLIKEQDLYACGELYRALDVFGKCVILKNGLHGLMGPDREVTEDQWVTESDPKIEFEEKRSENILMDIQSRYKDDKAYLLMTLKKAGSRVRCFEQALLTYQIYILQEYNDFEAAASYVGLLEKVHLHPNYELSKNWEVLNRISEHILCCHTQHSQTLQHVNLLSHSLFLEGTFRQVLRKTMIYLLYKKHWCEQKTLCTILNGKIDQKDKVMDAEQEEDKLKEIRGEMGSKQVAGTFLVSLQNKQISIFKDLVAYSSKDKTRLLSELLFCQMDEATTCIADMLTMGKLELSVLVQSTRSDTTAGYNDNIKHVLCYRDVQHKCKRDLDSWFLLVLRKLLKLDSKENMEVYRLIISKNSAEDPTSSKLPFASANASTTEPSPAAASSNVLSLNTGASSTSPSLNTGASSVPPSSSTDPSPIITTEYLQKQGMRVVPAENMWGLLPSQMTPVEEAVLTEMQLLKDEELSEEEKEVRISEVNTAQSNKFLKQTPDLLLSLSQYGVEVNHILRNQSSLTLTPLFCYYGNLLLAHQDILPDNVMFCYLSHLLRMTVSHLNVTCLSVIRDAARAFLKNYNEDWAKRAPLGSKGMISLVRDYATIHYTISSYREYLLTCLHKHHTMELSLLTGILLDIPATTEHDKEEDKEEKGDMSEKERVEKMKILHDHWNVVQSQLRAITVFDEESSVKTSQLHLEQRKLLTAAVTLKMGSVVKRIRYREAKDMHEAKSRGLSEARVELLAELINCHVQDISDSIRSLHDMTMLELASLKVTLHHNVKAGIVGSVANVCFTPIILDKFEQVAEELEDKYDILRDKLYAAALIKNIGEQQWTLLSQQDQQKRIAEMRLQARKLRNEGREHEVEAMLAEALANEQGIIEMMGVSKEEYLRALEEKKKLRRQIRKKVLEDGTEVEEVVYLDDKGNEVEITQRSISEILNTRFEAEKEELLRRLRDADNQYSTARDRQSLRVKLRLEKKRLQQQETFEEAILVLGMASKAGDRLLSEKERQEALAKARIAARKKKLLRASSKTGLIDNGYDIDINTEEAGELQEVLVSLVHAKYEGEREMLQQLIDSVEPEQLENVVKISRKERQNEIGLLREDHKKWREGVVNSVPTAEQLVAQQDRNRECLRNAVLLNLANVLGEVDNVEYNTTIVDEKERRDDYETRRIEEATIRMMVLLQEKQDDEEAMILGNIKHKGLSEVKSISLTHKRAVAEGWMDNIGAVVFARRTEVAEEEEEVIRELDKKYDNMKDTLILQMLEQQIGAEEWVKLSEKERQKKAMHLKLREKQLRVAGREKEADELYQAMVSIRQHLEEDESAARKRQKEKIKKRLEYRKWRLESGASREEVDVEMEEMMRRENEKEQSQRESVSAKELLAKLTHGYEAEKEALIAQLYGEAGKLKSEKERQLAILKLKREQLRVRKDAEMDAAAMVFRAARSQDMKVEDARKHQMFLAKQRILARKQKVKAKEGEEEKMEETKEGLPQISSSVEATGQLRDSIIELVEQKHGLEREIFMDIVQKLSNLEVLTRDELNKLRSTPSYEIDAKLLSIRRVRLRHLKSVKGAAGDTEAGERMLDFKELQNLLLQDAVPLKLLPLIRSDNKSLSEQLEEAAVSVLAAIQERQEEQSEGLLQSLGEMGVGELSETRQLLHGDIVSGCYDNLCDVILGTATPEDHAVQPVTDISQSLTKRTNTFRKQISMKREARQLEKDKNQDNLDLLLKDLTRESDQSSEDATALYNQKKGVLDKIARKDTLSRLTSEERGLLADIEETVSPRGPQTETDKSKIGQSLTQEHIEELYANLKNNHQSQINQIHSQKEAQKRAMLAKMQLKIQIKDRKEAEEDQMRSMFSDFARSQTIVREQNVTGHSAAKEKLADILARKKQAAEQAADKLNMDNREDLSMRPHARESSRSTIEIQKQVSDQLGDSQEVLDSLIRQATSAELAKSRQRNKQAEQLRARIRARQMASSGPGGMKRDAIQAEAEELIDAMERDKTQLELVTSQESARQKAIIQQRIRKIRERAKSAQSDKKSQISRQTSDLGLSLLSAEEQLLPKKDRVQLIASRRQDKLQHSKGTDNQALAAMETG